MCSRIVGATLLTALLVAGPCAFAQPRNAAEASAEGLQSLASWLQDLAIEKKADRELKSLEPIIVKKLNEHPSYGVLVYFSIFKGPEGQRVLHSVALSGEGTTPKAALTEHRRRPTLSAAPPSGMLFDRDSSYFVWVTKKNGKLQTGRMSSLHARVLWVETAPDSRGADTP